MGQIVTTEEALQMKRYLGDHALLVDIRAAAEAPAGLALGSDVQVPFMEPVVASMPGNGADSQMEFRIDFGPNVDEALRAAHMRHGQPVILMSPFTERAVLAALLLQERGYSKIYVTRD
jgi:rhodanese-related sulfurtransferase